MDPGPRQWAVFLAILTAAVTPSVGVQVVPGAAAGQVGAAPRDTRPTGVAASVLRGRVTDSATGLPVRKAVVRILGPEVREPRTATTDVEGRYELRDLPAGRFTLTASKAGYIDSAYGQVRPQEPGKPVQLGEKQTVEKIDFVLTRGTVITGRVLDEYGEPIADVQVSALRNMMTATGRRPTPGGRGAITNDIGEFRLFGLAPGQYLVSAQYRPMMPMGPGDDSSGYALTYYPGTPDLSAAQPLTLGLGGSVSDVTIMLVAARTARVSGVVVDGQGRPVAQGSVMVMTRGGAPMVMPIGSGPIRPDGTFTIGGVPPGEYTLRGMLPSLQGGPPDAAIATVSINGIDLTDVRLEPVRRITVAGRVIVSPAAASSFRPQMFRFSASSTEMTFAPAAPPAPVQSDLTFSFQAVPGPSIVRMAVNVTGWMIKAVYWNGSEVTDSVTFPDEDVKDLEIELTNRIPEISGAVTDPRGQPVSDYTAIAFPQDRERWKALGAGRAGMVRPDDTGRFKFSTLRPGDYFIVAVDRVPNGEWMDPAFLESLQTGAMRISINEGDIRTLDLKLIDAR